MEQSVLIGPIAPFPNSPFSFLLRAQLPFSCSFPAWPPQVRATGITVQLEGDEARLAYTNHSILFFSLVLAEEGSRDLILANEI